MSLMKLCAAAGIVIDIVIDIDIIVERLKSM